MPARLPLGNDVVDLRLTENVASAANPAFADRVLAPEERQALCAATNPPLLLWAYWAGKETAYKSLRKCDPGLIFAHRRFVVTMDTPVAMAGESGQWSGSVVHGGRCVPVFWTWDDDCVHCVSVAGLKPPVFNVDTLARLRETRAFKAMRSKSNLSDASLAVRCLAQTLLAEHGVRDTDIVRPRAGRRSGPPQILRDGVVLPGVDVALTHDGRYIAAAVRIDAVAAGA